MTKSSAQSEFYSALSAVLRALLTLQDKNAAEMTKLLNRSRVNEIERYLEGAGKIDCWLLREIAENVFGLKVGELYDLTDKTLASARTLVERKEACEYYENAIPLCAGNAVVDHFTRR